MYFEHEDFNDAGAYFASTGAEEWSDVAEVVTALRPCFLPSQEKGRRLGSLIFDPKATNRAIKEAASDRGWREIRVPKELRAFGRAWDAGKGSTLAEWQFSNYPYLSNNVIRTEAAYQQQHSLEGLQAVAALLIVTRSSVFPASNSTLYYEQAIAQLEVALSLGVFDVPIRLVGLGVRPATDRLEASLSTYAGRTSRTLLSTEPCEMHVSWTGKTSIYGAPKAVFVLG